MSQGITLTNEVELEHAGLVESLGSLDRVPVLVTRFDELDARSVDHRAGFLLSQVDGATTLEEILDVSGMPPLEALRIVRDLVQRGIVLLLAGVPDHDEREYRPQ
jgi:hypothetical protein